MPRYIGDVLRVLGAENQGKEVPYSCTGVKDRTTHRCRIAFV